MIQDGVAFLTSGDEDRRGCLSRRESLGLRLNNLGCTVRPCAACRFGWSMTAFDRRRSSDEVVVIAKLLVHVRPTLGHSPPTESTRAKSPDRSPFGGDAEGTAPKVPFSHAKLDPVWPGATPPWACGLGPQSIKSVVGWVKRYSIKPCTSLVRPWLHDTHLRVMMQLGQGKCLPRALLWTVPRANRVPQPESCNNGA